MNQKMCQRCHGVFSHADGEDWKTFCIPCFKRKKAEERGYSFHKNERATHNERIVYVDKIIQEPIPPEIISQLIRLCHPDRHGNSDASNRMTAWLLDKRKK